MSLLSINLDNFISIIKALSLFSDFKYYNYFLLNNVKINDNNFL